MALIIFNSYFYLIIKLSGGKIMTTVKEEVIALIQQMPEDSNLSDIMAELYFRQKVDQGIKELDEGKGIPHEKVKKRIRDL
jgi:hypothetical protein